jgi:CelD/BcsL family acetyltransferase involved in cellulose biosynthesis
MRALTLEVVTEPAALAAEWEALWRRVPGASPFQSPAWLLPWWEVFGTGRPVVACLCDDAGLRGLLPLYVLREETRKLLPVGVGLSDYCDALLDPSLPDDAATLLLDAALRVAAVPVCDLPDVPPDSRLRQVTAPRGWDLQWRDTVTCPVLTVPADAKDVGQAVPARMRRKLRMNRNRAARLGTCRIEYADARSLDGAMQTLLRLGAQRWGDGDGAAWRFHRRAAPRLLRAGTLRLATLSVGDAVAACCYALADAHDRLLFYMSGFDPGYAAVSPGSLLIAGMIDDALVEGRREIHFLRGDEAYKYAWGAQDRLNAACRLVRRC